MGLLPDFNVRLKALVAAAQEAGFDPRVVSGYRSPDDQARAINSVSSRVLGRPASVVEYSRGIPGYAAPVGGSKHQKGEAADFAPGPALDWVRKNAQSYGVTFPASLARTDPVHAESDPTFWGPVQDPADRGRDVALPASAQPNPARMAQYKPSSRVGLGMSAANASPSPGAAPMALSDYSQPAQPQGFDLNQWISSPLFQMGAGVLGSPNIGQGLMQGSQAAAAFAQSREKSQRENELFPLKKQLMQAQISKAMEPPSSDDIRAFQFAKRDGFPGSFMDFLSRRKAQGLGNQPLMGVGPDGKPAVMRLGDDGLVVAKTPPGYSVDPRGVMKVDTGTGTAVVAPDGRTIATVGKDLAGAETQKKVGQDTGAKIAGLPKQEESLASYEAQHGIVNQDITKALKLAETGWATGLTGALANKLPGTTAYDLRRLVDTIKGNIGFDKLQTMRMESPTGGALGQVAVQELEMLQSVFGSLDQSQSKEQFKENLVRLGMVLNEFKQRRRQALEDDKKRFGGAVVGPPNVPIQARPNAPAPEPIDLGDGIKIRRLD